MQALPASTEGRGRAWLILFSEKGERLESNSTLTMPACDCDPSHQAYWDVEQRKPWPWRSLLEWILPVCSSGSLFAPSRGEMELKWNVNDERFHFLTWGKWRCWWICVIVTFYKHRQCKTISGLPARQQGPVAPHTGLYCGQREKQPDFTSVELTSPPSDLLST